MNRDTFIQDEIRNIARAKKQTKSKVTYWDMATMLISLHNVYHALQRFSGVITLRNSATVPRTSTLRKMNNGTKSIRFKY